jgi:hypothetical protein
MSKSLSPPAHDDPPTQHHLLTHTTASEAAFRRDYPVIWWASLLGPFVATAGVLVAIWVWMGKAYLSKFVLTALFAFFLAGRFIILTGVKHEGGGGYFLEPWQLFVMVVFMDLMCASLMIFHMGFLFNLPWLGPRLLELSEDGRFILRSHPWMRRVTFLGLVAFVTFPLAATGSIGGAIFGRLLGLSRPATLAGVVLGSLIGCGVMYFGNSWINHYIDRNNPVYTIGGIVVIAGLVFLLNHRYRKLKASRMKQEG